MVYASTLFGVWGGLDTNTVPCHRFPMENQAEIDWRLRRGKLIAAARKDAGLTQAELGKRVGTSQQEIGKIEKGIVNHARFLAGIAKVLGIDPPEIMPELATQRSEQPLIQESDLYRTGRQDFPVHVSAEGGPGEIIVSTDPVQWVVRPTPLVGVTQSYGIIIVGESMVPEFWPGDIALINPHMPPERGATFVFYAEQDGETRATVKHLLRWSETLWHVRQWNAPKGQKQDFTLPRSEWGKCHKVVGRYSK